MAVFWKNPTVAECYVSPNYDLAWYERYLEGAGRYFLGHLTRPVLVLDFNAHVTAWDMSPTWMRRRLKSRLLNQGSMNTCVQWNDSTIFDHRDVDFYVLHP